jgi:hypothetical protein
MASAEIDKGAYDLSDSVSKDSKEECSVLSVSGQDIVQTIETEKSSTGDALASPGAHARTPGDERSMERSQDRMDLSIAYVI